MTFLADSNTVYLFVTVYTYLQPIMANIDLTLIYSFLNI